MKIISIHSKNIVTLLVILFLGTSFFSCKDFLDVDDYFKHTTQLDSVFQRKEQVEQYIREQPVFFPMRVICGQMHLLPFKERPMKISPHLTMTDTQPLNSCLMK